MSTKALLSRAIQKGSKTRIKILSPVSTPGPSGMNASKKTTYKPGKSFSCVWIWKDATNDNEVGERQEYRAVCQIRPEVLGAEILSPDCRIEKESFGEWLIDTIHPVQELEGFSLIRIEVRKPKAGGNKV
ncbi:hypothetical protein FH581_022045 [Leptospira weilii]|uniref:hypothetical protein n=1 Tax=Leptospira weilii TaxID=28184 RepID=UPI001EF28CEC|nr:hypothetical protein [Leptospira weilii]ULH28729.1 hypothetical protein FH586_01895 [Leptospira weilii]ULH28803.1 hypothetical protein FH586_02285 [Leptospira weilii]ULH30013.1 hypothetical protein FH586_09260 [Leptospira weilii]UPY76758.1 hypothetical protein FH581_024415 [Leptospira weilii]UPY79564.1 hypothetical protein FH581_012205 [Leptospira weilii]